MRILIFIHSLSGGGAERVTAHMSQWWVNRGHEVVIATMAAGAASYGVDPRVRVLALGVASQSRDPLAAVSANLRRMGSIRRTLKAVRPDCCIGMMTDAAILLALGAFGMRLRILGSERTYPPGFPLKPAWELLRKVAYRRLDALVMQTEQGAEWARAELGLRAVHVIPNPVVWPLEAKEPVVSPATVLQPGRRLLVSAGRLDANKDFPALLRIFARLARIHQDWDLVILGEGPARPEIEALAQDLGLAGRIFTPGRVGNIGQWFEAASIFALTSRLEGFPNVLLEARACGLPVVSFDCKTGPSDIIADGRDGFLVPLGDEARFAAALDELMKDEAKRLAMGAFGQGGDQRFDIDTVMERWSALAGGQIPRSGG